MKTVSFLKSMVAGVVAGEVGWVVMMSPEILRLKRAGVASTFWHSFFLTPAAVCIVVALLFPLWRRLLRYRNLLAECISFCIVAGMLLIVPSGLLTYYRSAHSAMPLELMMRAFAPHKLLAGGLAAGFVFYLVGRLLRIGKDAPLAVDSASQTI